MGSIGRQQLLNPTISGTSHAHMCAQRVAWQNEEVLTAEHFQHLEAWVEGLVHPVAAASGWGLTRFAGEKYLNHLPLLSATDGWTKNGRELEAWCTIQPLRAITRTGRLLEVSQESRLKVTFTPHQVDGANSVPVFLVPAGPPRDVAPMRPYQPAVALESQLSEEAQNDAIQIAEFRMRSGGLVPTDPFIPMCADIGACVTLTQVATAATAAVVACREAVLATMKSARELPVVSGEQLLRFEALRATDGVCRFVELSLADPRASVVRLIPTTLAAVRHAFTALTRLGFAAPLVAAGADKLNMFAALPNLFPFFDQLRATFVDLRGWVAGLSLKGPEAPPVADIPHDDGLITDVTDTRWRRVAIPLRAALGASLGPGARVRVQLVTTNHAPEGEVRVHPTAAPGLQRDHQLVAHSCQLCVNSDRQATFEYTPGNEDRAADALVFYVQRKVADVLPHAGWVLSAAVVQIIPV